MDLFTLNMEKNINKYAPLAERFRPRNLDEFVGQSHIVGENKFLNRLIKSDRIMSMIFYGPPGTGKTTLASIIANTTNNNFEKLSAVTSGVGDIRKVTSIAEENLKLYNKKTILFIDEIHRFNKSQQDALLPFVEKGIIVLIGATTENPLFEVNSALLSRCRVIRFNSIDDEELRGLIFKVLKDKERGLGNSNIELTEEAIVFLLNHSGGDARYLLNTLEVAVLSTDPNEDGKIYIDGQIVKECSIENNIRYDKSGDGHYDTISAFIKSIRGSDPDAAIYWLAKMIEAGENPKFIARRLVISASEDIGLADPNALVVATSAFDAVNLIGFPEGRIPLAEATIYLATAPKSNTAYEAINRAMEDIASNKLSQVPEHLKNIKIDKNTEPYKNPHKYEGGLIKQDYLDSSNNEKQFYYPKEIGYEKSIYDRLEDISKKINTDDE
ncbi:MAG: replication-associated recombination protein A [Tissierellia bacterium]|nr:replication-associated recombination protein A [Tissierellia bacterium]